MEQVDPLDTALGLFTRVKAHAADVAAPSMTKRAVVLFVPPNPDHKQKRELHELLVPVMFLFRGRDDIVRRVAASSDKIVSSKTLLQCVSNEMEMSCLAVFIGTKQGATITLDDPIRDRICKLVEEIGWSPDCPDATHLPNYLSPLHADELLQDVAAFTISTGQRDYVANAANVASIIWHAFVKAGRPINWAGFYFVRPLTNPKKTDHDHLLLLGPFQGKPACSRIRFESGVCGAAWRTKSVQRIANVHAFPGHIACDEASESELVVPILDKHGEVTALLDLDCPTTNGFSAEDERTFVEVARVMAEACDWTNTRLPYTQP
ncbi:hypothetical protein PsorP6_006429 [Peronosclerospora sorghi]|uniref:Uncharacterized protein n=1 Tax=Peronosclerospora sorghi TaxID=230839 RepID=A0ACC0W5Z5_9STRA|nr:hypothetical protein PsorP6_006429 [Peronosclerospora sorghi]